MIQNLRLISKILILLPIGLLVWDLVVGWFVYADLNIRDFESVWKSMFPESLEAFKSADISKSVLGKKALSSPGPVTLLFPPVIIYVIYRILFVLNKGHGSKFRYKSRD